MSRDDVTQTKIYIVKIECKIHSIWEYNRTFLKHNRARFTLDRFIDTKDRPFFFFNIIVSIFNVVLLCTCFVYKIISIKLALFQIE